MVSGLRGQTSYSALPKVRGRPPASSGAAETDPLPRRWRRWPWGRGAEGSKPARGRSRELLNHPIPAGFGVSAALAGTLAGGGWRMLRGVWTAQVLTERFPHPHPSSPTHQLAHAIRMLLEFTDTSYEEKRYTCGEGNATLGAGATPRGAEQVFQLFLSVWFPYVWNSVCFMGLPCWSIG